MPQTLGPGWLVVVKPLATEKATLSMVTAGAAGEYTSPPGLARTA